MPQKGTPNRKYKTGELVETLCDDEEESVWLPARVSKTKVDKVVLTLLGDTESFQVEQSFIRPIPNHGGQYINTRDIIEGADCSVWHAQSGAFFPAVVQFFDNEDTAVILYVEYDDEEEVPVDYIRSSEHPGTSRSVRSLSFASPKKSEVSALSDSDSDDARPSSPHFLSKQPSFFDDKEDYQIEAEIIWEKLEAHLKRSGIKLGTFLKRNVTKDGYSIDSTLFERALKRNLKLEVVGHRALTEVTTTAQHKALKLGLLKESKSASDVIGRTGIGATALSPVPKADQSPQKSSMSMRSQERGNVGKHRSMRVPLPEDPQEALDEMLDIIRPALKRLKITPLSFFNMANKKKRKFVDSADIANALHSLTKMDINAGVMVEVMSVLDPEGTKKVDTKTMKLNFKSLVADEAAAKYEREKKEKIELERQKREEEKQEMIRKRTEKREAEKREIERLEAEKKALQKRQKAESKRSMSFVEVKSSRKVQKETNEPPIVSDRAPVAKHAPVAVRPTPSQAPIPIPAPAVSTRVKPKLVEPWKPARGMLVEVNVGDEEDEEDGDQWLPASVVSDMHTDGTIEVRMLVGYEAEEATFETDSYYCREIDRKGNLIDPVKCLTGLRVCCLNALSDEFQDATIIAPVSMHGTIMVRFDRRDSYDSEDSEDEEEEQEVPLTYLRSLNGLEDMQEETVVDIVQEAVEEVAEIEEQASLHTLESEEDTEEEKNKEYTDEEQSEEDIEEKKDKTPTAKHIDVIDYSSYAEPTNTLLGSETSEESRERSVQSLESSSQSNQSDEGIDNELSELLDCVGCRDFYNEFYSLTGSSSAHELYLAGKDSVFSVKAVSLAQRQTLWKLLKEQFRLEASRMSEAPSTARSATPFKMEPEKGFLSFLRSNTVDDIRGMSVENRQREDSREASMDRAALYGWQRMLEEKDLRDETRKKFKVVGEEHKEQDEEAELSSDMVRPLVIGHDKEEESVIAWELPVSVTVVLGDGVEITGTPAETSWNILAATDNFIFRNLDALLDALAQTSSRQRVGEHDLPLRTISHQLRKLGAPISVTTGPLYLWQYLVDFHRCNSESNETDEVPSFGLADTPELSSGNYRVLLPFIANKHLMDMLTLASKTDDSFISLLTSWKESGGIKGGHFDEKVNEENIRSMVEALSHVLMRVANQNAVGTKHHHGHSHHHHHHHHHQEGHKVNHRAFDACVNLDSNSGRHPLWWTKAGSYAPMAEDFVRSIFHEVRSNPKQQLTPFTLQHRIYNVLRAHANAQDTSQKISTSYRTREAAEEMLIVKKTSMNEERRRVGSWLKRVDSSESANDSDSMSSDAMSEDSRLCDEVEEEGFLQDRMCYFIIGNLHRLRAELKDRGICSSSGTHTVPVSTAVRALKVATSCTYPPLELAKLLAKVSKLGNYSSYSDSRSLWDIPVDISMLDVKIDKYLMTI